MVMDSALGTDLAPDLHPFPLGQGSSAGRDFAPCLHWELAASRGDFTKEGAVAGSVQPGCPQAEVKAWAPWQLQPAGGKGRLGESRGTLRAWAAQTLMPGTSLSEGGSSRRTPQSHWRRPPPRKGLAPPSSLFPPFTLGDSAQRFRNGRSSNYPPQTPCSH